MSKKTKKVRGHQENSTIPVSDPQPVTDHTRVEQSRRHMPSSRSDMPSMLFSKENYKWMLIGLAFIFLGFLLMVGGRSSDPNVFKPDELYSFRRITLAPILVLIGFVIEGYAILRKPKSNN